MWSVLSPLRRFANASRASIVKPAVSPVTLTAGGPTAASAPLIAVELGAWNGPCTTWSVGAACVQNDGA